jgi:hypothetical protein
MSATACETALPESGPNTLILPLGRRWAIFEPRGGVKADFYSQFCYLVVFTWPSKYGGNSAPTEGWSDGSQNCLHDMRIVGNT